MAEKTLNTRVQLRFDTLANWQDTSKANQGANLVLKAGEVAVCQVPASQTAINGDTSRPQYLFKVGDGSTPFKDLEWVSAKAADVYDWAKAATKPAYTASEVSGLGAAATKGVVTSISTSTNLPTAGAVKTYVDTNSTKVESSTTNGNIKINGTETTVYTLPSTVLTTASKGVANGVASLGSDGKVPSSQLPSYVDDVLEYATKSQFPATGESAKIYIALDTNLAYRWSGSAYVEISPSLALGETSSTAYRGDRGKTAYDHSQLTSGNPHNVTKANVGLGNVDNKSSATIRSEITSANVTTALGYTPTKSSGTITPEHLAYFGADSNELYDSGIDKDDVAVKSEIPTESTVTGWGFTKNAGTVTSVSAAANSGFKITGTASVNPKIDWDDTVTFVLNGGSASTVI